MQRTGLKWKAPLIAAMAVACSTQATEIELEVGGPVPGVCDYPQAYGNPQHTGMACPEVAGLREVATLGQDPDADAENDASGFLQVHLPAPLIVGDFVVVPRKSGFETVFDRSTEHYGLDAYRWVPSVVDPNAELVPIWQGDTGWQPTDSIIQSLGSYTNGYVAQYSAVIANGSVYTPDRWGRVRRFSLATGALQATIDPLAGTPFSGDERTIVTNALSSDGHGHVHYAVVAWPLINSRGATPRGAWLAEVGADNSTRRKEWDLIASPAVGVPTTSDLCEYPFGTSGTAPPTGPDSRAPRFGCGRQRPAMNTPFAYDAGQIIVYSYANNAQGAAFTIDVDAATLTPIRAFDTRGHLRYGCGDRLSIDFGNCDVLTAGGTTNIGADPNFNGFGRFRGEDIMKNSVSVAPDGRRCIGSYDGGFVGGGEYDARGAGVCADRSGRFAAKNESYWWDSTPSAWEHGNTYSYFQDQQLFSDGFQAIARYSPDLDLESTGGSDIQPFDWLDANVSFGPSGAHYAVDALLGLVKFSADGGVQEILQLSNPDGTPRQIDGLAGYQARDRAGRLYRSGDGFVHVIAGGGTVTSRRVIADNPKLTASKTAKQRAAMTVQPVDPPDTQEGIKP